MSNDRHGSSVSFKQYKFLALTVNGVRLVTLREDVTAADVTYGNVTCAFWSCAEPKELRSGSKCEVSSRILSKLQC